MLPANIKKAIPLVFILITLFVVVILLALFYLPQKNSNKGAYDPTKKVGYFHGKEFTVPSEISFLAFNYEDVLGSSKKRGEKRIEVDLTNQKLYAYEGSKKKYSFDVSTGKWGRTPTGEFRVYTKLKYTLMAGGNKAIGTYYYLPNVPFTMYFYRDYGIHGAYWHDNFGHPMSHGCVNMRIADSEKLFYWADPPVPDNVNSVTANKDNQGTKVIVYGVAPNE